MLHAIHSGGQTGADQGGLAAAVVLGLRTGGWAPKGYRTEDGPAPWLVHLGLREHCSSGYRVRTRLNVIETDATLVFGQLASPGSKLTVSLGIREDKPVFTVPWSVSACPEFLHEEAVNFGQWLRTNKFQVLNVAGNRASVNLGIRDAVRDFVVAAVRG